MGKPYICMMHVQVQLGHSKTDAVTGEQQLMGCGAPNSLLIPETITTNTTPPIFWLHCTIFANTRLREYTTERSITMHRESYEWCAGVRILKGTMRMVNRLEGCRTHKGGQVARGVRGALSKARPVRGDHPHTIPSKYLRVKQHSLQPAARRSARHRHR